ncbi:MAG: ABC transporter ATP-binding protein [Solirubrobacteraceae bacterium]|jgi:peptide/nickel transport system ATP-binding protein
MSTEQPAGALLSVENLSVQFPTHDGVVHAVDGISYTVDRAASIGIVGESGSGKTVAALTLLGLTVTQGAIVTGQILFDGRDLLTISKAELRHIRGNEIAMIFQDPLSSLHPQFRVGAQIVEAMRIHRSITRAAARTRAIELLELVGIPDPRRRVDQYPHEFSGGMRQRAMIAMSLSNEPKLLIADEPTTALDVTVQAQILALLERLRHELGMAMIMITHDLGVVAQIADRINVMYAGRIVESAEARPLFSSPQHPYTWGLLRSIPTLDGPRGVELLPIPGRPPSMIRRPTGCFFHPRCAYALPSHSTIDPPLSDVGLEGGGDHRAACLLDAAQRQAAWAALKGGGTPEQARVAAGIEQDVVPVAEAEIVG